MLDYDKAWKEEWGGMQKYGPIHRHQRRLFLKIIRIIKKIAKNEIKSVLDAGCGEGSNLLFLKTIFPVAKFFGCDISLAAIEKAKQTFAEADFFQMDIEKQKVDSKFDFILSCDVLEHIEKDDQVLRNIHRMCNKYFLISSVQGRMRRFEKNVGHLRNYRYGELEKKVERAGFSIVSKLEWGFPWYSPLYRELFNNQNIENSSYGQYNFFKKSICNIIFILFFLNLHNKGDLIILLCKK